MPQRRFRSWSATWPRARRLSPRTRNAALPSSARRNRPSGTAAQPNWRWPRRQRTTPGSRRSGAWPKPRSPRRKPASTGPRRKHAAWRSSARRWPARIPTPMSMLPKPQPKRRGHWLRAFAHSWRACRLARRNCRPSGTRHRRTSPKPGPNCPACSASGKR